jgi:hypothetical protein
MRQLSGEIAQIDGQLDLLITQMAPICSTSAAWERSAAHS